VDEFQFNFADVSVIFDALVHAGILHGQSSVWKEQLFDQLLVFPPEQFACI